MKKVLFILLSCFLVLAACSNNNNDSKKSTSVDENKVQFTNDTLVLDQAVLKIKDTFLVNDKDLDNGKKLLAFKYEVKSKDGDEQITPMNVWIASMETTQDSENTESKLEVGPTPNTGNFEEWDKHNNDVIKKGKTAKGIITYELENDKQVTLKATKGTEGKKLGTKKINISKLKTVDYSAADDITNDSASSSKEGNKDVANNESESTSKNDNGKSQDNNGNNERTQGKQAQATQQKNNQQQANNNQQMQNNNGYMTQSEIDEWNRTKTTTHNESQMEEVPQNNQNQGVDRRSFNEPLPRSTTNGVANEAWDGKI